MKCSDIIELLEQLSPTRYACEWDNVGLLVGRREKEVRRVLIALDATIDVVEYACAEKYDMLITHHPMIFTPEKSITDDTVLGKKILLLAEHGVCYYAMHTNFDTVGGMAEVVASRLGLTDTKPMVECDIPGQGMGRYGKLPKPMNIDDACQYIMDKLDLNDVKLYNVKDLECADARNSTMFENIAVMPGSGKSFIKKVSEDGYSLYLTGDIGHHEAIDANELNINVIDATHRGLEYLFEQYIFMYLIHKREEMLSQGKLDGAQAALLSIDYFSDFGGYGTVVGRQNQ